MHSLLSLMQGLFNAPLQEENNIGVVFKDLMSSNFQGVEMFQLFFDVDRPILMAV